MDVETTIADGRMFIDGNRSWAMAGATFDAVDPSTGQAFTRVALGAPGDVDGAVKSARASLDAGWSGLPPVRRVRILNRLAVLLRGPLHALPDREKTRLENQTLAFIGAALS